MVALDISLYTLIYGISTYIYISVCVCVYMLPDLV